MTRSTQNDTPADESHDAGDSESPFSSDALRLETEAVSGKKMSAEQRREWRRLVEALRRAMDVSLSLGADRGTLESLANLAVGLADQLEVGATGRGIPLFGAGPDDAPDDLGALMPFSPVAGPYNPVAPPVEIRPDGDRVVGRVRFGALYQGAPGLVHGAVISSVYDEVLAMANMTNRVSGPTARLTVRYRKPTPLYRELRFEAWVDRVRDRYVHTRGRCYDGETLLTDAEGVFVQIDRGLSG